MKRVLLIILCIQTFIPLFSATHYLNEGGREWETFVKLEKENKELRLILERNGVEEIFTGNCNKGIGTLVNGYSTETMTISFPVINYLLLVNQSGEELKLKEIALEYVQNRKLNRLSSELKYPKFLLKDEFAEQVEKHISEYFELNENEFWQEGLSTLLNEPDYFIGYDINLNAELELISPELISLSFSDYRYTGGAHGNYMFNGFNYHWNNNELEFLSLEDIFAKENVADVSELCISKLNELGAVEVLRGNKKEFTPDELCYFSFSNIGMTFYFAPYMLDCYAAGDFKVLLSWKELENYIKADSPLYKFVKRL